MNAPDAAEYQQVADTMRLDARFYLALIEEVKDRPEMLTFAKPYADGLRRRYQDLADFCHEAAYQAQAVADARAAARAVAQAIVDLFPASAVSS